MSPRGLGGSRDDEHAEPRLLGVGRKYTLTGEEREWIRKFAAAAEIANQLADISPVVEVFTRAFFNTEIHSEMFKGVRSRCSYHVALLYHEDDGPCTYFATVHKFFKLPIRGVFYRVALITSYYNKYPTPFGTKVDQGKTYKTGKIIVVQSIDRKVIFTKETPTKVLEIPNHYKLGVKKK